MYMAQDSAHRGLPAMDKRRPPVSTQELDDPRAIPHAYTSERNIVHTTMPSSSFNPEHIHFSPQNPPNSFPSNPLNNPAPTTPSSHPPLSPHAPPELVALRQAMHSAYGAVRTALGAEFDAVWGATMRAVAPAINECARWRAEAEALRRALEQSERLGAEREGETERLRAERDKAQEERDKARTERDQAMEERRRFANENESLKRERAEMRAKLATYADVGRGMMAEISRLGEDGSAQSQEGGESAATQGGNEGVKDEVPVGIMPDELMDTLRRTIGEEMERRFASALAEAQHERRRREDAERRMGVMEALMGTSMGGPSIEDGHGSTHGSPKHERMRSGEGTLDRAPPRLDQHRYKRQRTLAPGFRPVPADAPPTHR